MGGGYTVHLLLPLPPVELLVCAGKVKCVSSAETTVSQLFAGLSAVLVVKCVFINIQCEVHKTLRGLVVS